MMNKTSHDSETPANGKQVFTGCAFIHHNFNGIDKVFLPKRAATKKFLPNIFELPGGHIDYGEEIVDGLKREINEEFGMDTQVGDPFYVFTYENPIKGSHSIEVIYFAKFLDPIDHVKLDPEDHSEYRWVAGDEIDSIITDLKNDNDPEIKAIRKGFSLLKGNKLNFV